MVFLWKTDLDERTTISLSSEELLELQIYNTNITEINMKLNVLYADIITHIGRKDENGSFLRMRENEEWKVEFEKMIDSLNNEIIIGEKMTAPSLHIASHEKWKIHLDLMDKISNDLTLMVYEKEEVALERLKASASEVPGVMKSYDELHLKEWESIKNYE